MTYKTMLNFLMRCSVLLLIGLAYGLIVSPSPSSAQTDYLTRDPQWQSLPGTQTKTVAVGDVDLDGDLDIVIGIFAARNVLYLNENGILANTPAWESDPGNLTYSVALGDINGDGYLDLVCANLGQPTVLYMNNGGSFSNNPTWSTSQNYYTYAIILGDVDNDNDLDLACGNSRQSNTIFFNIDGTLEDTPSWSSQVRVDTRAIALADVNGNGYLDLVCGNYNQRNTLYFNSGGTFPIAPSWLSDPANATFSIALGDVNADGTIDLVCGNGDQGNTLYLNFFGSLTTNAVWSTTTQNSTQGIALGDIDGDGFLDMLCGNYGQANAVYKNLGIVFSPVPDWESNPENLTHALIAADMDMDGDLDLVCGNGTQGSTLYTNLAPLFNKTPDWETSLAKSTTSIAFGDVDADEDLDMVFGNFVGRDELFINIDGDYQTSADWLSDDELSVRSVDLGDINGDRLNDLVCGLSGPNLRKNIVYLNIGGEFENRYSWSSEFENGTYVVKLRDLDGDGDLDLVCGNNSSNNQSVTLYRNNGGMLSGGIVLLPRNEFTGDLLLEDVNGDGDLDLICGNVQDETGLYLNRNGTFPREPDWETDVVAWATSIALGDINADGIRDLVIGNHNGENLIYLGNGTTFDSPSVWSPQTTYDTGGISLGDVNGDGYIDLVCGNLNQNNTVYLNTAGEIAEIPVWVSNDMRSTNSAKSVDFDKDGDLDLVFANFGQANAIYKGNRNPVYKGDPTNPTNQTPNNSAHLRYLTIHRRSENTYTIPFTAVDVESDPLWILVEYQFEGNPTWYAAHVNGSWGRTGPFISSPHGVVDSLIWDVSIVPFSNIDIALRIRTIPVPRRVSQMRHISSYIFSVGNIIPIRSTIALSTAALDFPTITVGDTTSLDFEITNQGNSILMIDSLTYPAREMQIDRTPPFSILPGITDTISLIVAPREMLDASGLVELHNNDPVTPVGRIEITTDIRALEIEETNLINTSEKLPLGDAVSIVVIPAPDVRVERGTLFYRPGGNVTQAWRMIPLLPFKNDFIAVIPGEDITEAGLEYYAEVENSGIFATDPVTAPDSFFTRDVEQPTGISSIARPNSPLGFYEYRPIRVDVALPDGTIYVSGALHARVGGDVEYREYDLTMDDSTPFGIIPGSEATSRGLEYWVEVHTLSRMLTDPPGDPAHNPHLLQIAIPSLMEPETHPRNFYRLISIPLVFSEDFTGTLEDLLADQPEFGAYNKSRWRSFSYVPELTTYLELTDEGAETYFRPEPGRAYWLIAHQENRIATSPVTGFSTPTSNGYLVTLKSGWNQLGNPYVFPVGWDSIRVDTTRMGTDYLMMAEAESTVVEPVIGWDIEGGYRDSIDVLVPFDGYWVKNLLDSSIIFLIPPMEVTVEEEDTTAAPLRISHATKNELWQLTIEAICGQFSDGFNRVGIRSGAANGWDRHDRSEPPLKPGNTISLYFPHADWKKRTGRYTVDIRGDYEEIGSHDKLPVSPSADLWGHEWYFDVFKSFSNRPAGDEVLLRFRGIERIPLEAEIFLIDRDLGHVIDLRRTPMYTYFSNQREMIVKQDDTRFLLLMGSENYIGSKDDEIPNLPTRTVLHQNYPNPFNPSTIIRYELASAGRVSLRIYDARGSLVKILYQGHRDPGRYENGWDGVNQQGSAVATGVYFCRLDVNNHLVETRKLVLIK